jgi:hypothetical protein
MATEAKTTEQKCEAANLKQGDILSRTSYMKVLENNRYKDSISVQNEDGKVWDISTDIVSAECYTAHQAEEEITVNRTELIEIFSNVGDAIFTVNFNKMPTADDFLALTRDEGNKIRSFEDMKRDFKKLKGENRTIVGYLIKKETGFGRSLVISAFQEIDGKKAIKNVDHRELNWLIVKNKKYVVGRK